eukprot:TRINITY_DN16731_c0_g1_i1.p1 TRINITY_DN16731_c0_g1~~TRINITY_DN16731_c0_g1_i1.p1  ORF type:complete len:141 (-),score=21.11 TRINITY_DN16731_c0_g1_i1:182-604(-)
MNGSKLQKSRVYSPIYSSRKNLDVVRIYIDSLSDLKSPRIMRSPKLEVTVYHKSRVLFQTRIKEAESPIWKEDFDVDESDLEDLRFVLTDHHIIRSNKMVGTAILNKGESRLHDGEMQIKLEDEMNTTVGLLKVELKHQA